MKRFNVTGNCDPDRHYMVDIRSKLAQIAAMVDIVLDYGTDQFIIELKLWNGDSMHDKAYTQLLGYMDSRGANHGYLLTFDFRLDFNKERKAEWVEIGGRHIFDVIV